MFYLYLKKLMALPKYPFLGFSNRVVPWSRPNSPTKQYVQEGGKFETWREF